MPDAQEMTPQGREVLARITAESVISLFPLEVRQDGDQYIAGRIELGEFVALPGAGVRVIELFNRNLPFGEVQQQLDQECGGEVDITDFVANLVDLGFVRAIDGQPLAERDIQRSNLEWLNPGNTGWLYSRPLLAVYFIVLAWAAWRVVMSPGLIPAYQDYFWSPLLSITILGNTAIFLGNLLIHELSHILAARSLNIPVRLELGTRLMNLVVQTNVTGLWAHPRRDRLRVYLAGLRWELLAIAVSLLLLSYAPLPGLAAAILKSVILHIFMMGVMFQAQVYMRTDLYFVLADLWRCYNLFGDSMAYLTHRLRRLRAIAGPGPAKRTLPNPLLDLPTHEQRKVRLFSAIVLLGAGSAIAMFFIYGLPIIVGVFIRAFGSLWQGIVHRQPVPFCDGLAVIVVEGFFQASFLAVAWKQRRDKFAWLKNLFAAEPPA